MLERTVFHQKNAAPFVPFHCLSDQLVVAQAVLVPQLSRLERNGGLHGPCPSAVQQLLL